MFNLACLLQISSPPEDPSPRRAAPEIRHSDKIWSDESSDDPAAHFHVSSIFFPEC